MNNTPYPHHLFAKAMTIVALMFGLQACAPSAGRFSGESALADQQKNAIGQSVVLRLRERFKDTRPECPGRKAGLYCNGVLIRALTSAWEDPEFWKPDQDDIDRNGISFSYLRADVGSKREYGNAGFIMRELDAPTQEPLAARCAFAVNGMTSIRPDSCALPELPFACHQMRVVDAQSWLAHYGEHSYRSCYFAPSAEWFQLSITVRQYLSEPERQFWNEVVIQPWTQNAPERLPLEALWFSGGGIALEKARTMQTNFIKTTGLFIPIVRLDSTSTDVFYYAPRDQAALATKTQN